MKLRFLGAAGTVTGSKTLVDTPDRRLLVDCGLFQGYKQLRLRNRAPFPVPESSVDAVLLTHAHLDHSGHLPLLVRDGFRGPAWCTAPTKDLCTILLPDSGWLQEEEAEYANRKGFSRHRPALPLYTREDAIRSLVHLTPVKPGSTEMLGGGVDGTWLSAGHILGAASVRLEHDGTSVLFSGDLGRPDDVLAWPPDDPPAADWVVVESTYGDRTHPRRDAADELAQIVRETAERGGITLIPAFAVGRTQALIVHLARLRESGRIPNVPVYVNSPMATDVTKLHVRHPDAHRLDPDECARIFGAVRYVAGVAESKELVSRDEPAVVISASGMATGGRVLHHLRRLLPDSKHSVVFSGYQAGGTRGRRMLDGADAVRIFGESVPVRARLHALDTLSAHADRDELVAWLSRLPSPPRGVFVTHGEPGAADTLRLAVRDRLGWEPVVPEHGESFELG